ncbi:MAG: GTP-binding protein [bacterium]|nr:GTP-binding protein [bacterium]
MAKTEIQSMERPPIVVIMGHVDHGKSTLLDFIRKSNIVATEHGGITQHVAAYEVLHMPQKNADRTQKAAEDLPRDSASSPRSSALSAGKRITFIDTPGHAAFGAIRARGANVADIAVLVVAADDGVKAQTLEALAQIREAKIPFIVAINKIDKPNANIERTQASLMEKEVYLEKLGGDVPWTAISAKEGTGVEELLDLILVLAEMNEYKADASAPATGYVIEAHRDQKRGIAATLIITEGTLSMGMAVLVGRAVSPVRIMENHLGTAIKTATFSTPVQLVGFDQLPDVGESFTTFKNKREAEAARPEVIAKVTAALAEENTEQFSMPVIIRADATGSLEAIAHELLKIGDEYKRVSLVQSGIGTISENDVKAAMSGTIPGVVFGFNVGIDPIAQDYARQHSIRIEFFNIIYKLTEKLQEILDATAPKRAVEEVLGRAKVLKQFSSRKDERVVGGRVDEGYVSKNAPVRVMRRGVAVGMGKIKNIQTNKQDVQRVDEGGEFGAQIASDFEIAHGDILECVITTMK